MADDRLGPAEEFAGHVLDLEAEEILDLRAGDEHRDAVGEAHNYRPGQEFDGRPEPGEAEQDQHDSGHERADIEPVDAVPGDDAEDDDDERPGRPADLRAGPA